MAKRLFPGRLLVGRNCRQTGDAGARPRRVALDHRSGCRAWTIPTYSIYFDAQTTDRRAESVRKAIAAGKHVYCEKPSADSLEAAYDLYQLARKAGVKHGVVQDKLWLPGLLKLRALRDQRLLRQDIFRPRRIRLLGLRR